MLPYLPTALKLPWRQLHLLCDVHVTHICNHQERNHTPFCDVQVECLANRMLPYLPTALQVLMHVTADCQDMCDVVALLNQLMLRFKTALQDLLKEVMSFSTTHPAFKACLAATGTVKSCECSDLL